jgi:hypothetical protein
MQIVLIEGFDQFPTGTLPVSERDDLFFRGTPVIADTVRAGATGRHLTRANVGFGFRGNHTNLYVGGWFKAESFVGAGFSRLFRLLNWTGTGAAKNAGDPRVYNDGSIAWGDNYNPPGEFYRSDPGVVDHTAWFHLEFMVRASKTTAGKLYIRVNGEPLVELNDVRTANTYTDYYLGLEPEGCLIDDLVVGVPDFNDPQWPGPCQVKPFYPSADVQADYSPSPAGDNYANVDDNLDGAGTHDEDATYNVSAGAEARDLFEHTGIGAHAGDPLAVQITAAARDASASARKLRPVIQHDTDESLGAFLDLVEAEYRRTRAVFSDVPGGSGWTRSQIDALHVGYEND